MTAWSACIFTFFFLVVVVVVVVLDLAHVRLSPILLPFHRHSKHTHHIYIYILRIRTRSRNAPAIANRVHLWTHGVRACTHTQPSTISSCPIHPSSPSSPHLLTVRPVTCFRDFRVETRTRARFTCVHVRRCMHTCILAVYACARARETKGRGGTRRGWILHGHAYNRTRGVTAGRVEIAEVRGYERG